MTVVAKGYYGLGGNLAVVLCAMRLAESLGRSVEVDWKNGIYQSHSIDVFAELFTTPSPFVADHLPADLKVHPPEWGPYLRETMPHVRGLDLSRSEATSLAALSNSETSEFDYVVVSRDDASWYDPEMNPTYKRLAQLLSPSPKVKRLVEDFAGANFGGKVLGVHFRHGNGERTVVPPRLSWFFKHADEYLQVSPDAKVFLSTDCEAVQTQFQKRYPENLIFTTKAFPLLGEGALHTGASRRDGIEVATEALVDMLLLSKSDFFLGSRSFFSSVAVAFSSQLDKASSRFWVPTVREFRPSSSAIAAENVAELKTLFESQNIDLSGIYLEQVPEGLSLQYLGQSLVTFRQLNEVDLAKVRPLLIDYRAY